MSREEPFQGFSKHPGRFNFAPRNTCDWLRDSRRERTPHTVAFRRVAKRDPQSEVLFSASNMKSRTTVCIWLLSGTGVADGWPGVAG